MTIEEFNELRKDLIKKCINTQEAKGKDYTKGNVNVLKAFVEGAEDFGVAPQKYLAFGFKKHINAIFNYIKTDGQSESEPIEMRIVDAMNYLMFLHALNKEREKGENNQ